MSDLLQTADLLQSAASACATNGVRCHSVSSAEFTNYYNSFRAFENHLKQHELDDVWGSQLKFHRLFRARFATSPIRAQELDKALRKKISIANEQALLANSEPTLTKLFGNLKTAYQFILKSSVNPLWEAWLKYTDDKENPPECLSNINEICKLKVGVLCFWNDQFVALHRLVNSTDSNAVKSRNYAVLKPSELKQDRTYDILAIIGSLRWLEHRQWSFILEAPRSKFIECFSFSVFPSYSPKWYHLDGSPHNFKEASTEPPTYSRSETLFFNSGNKSTPEIERIEADGQKTATDILDDLLPSLDIQSIGIGNREGIQREYGESIEANLMELSGSFGVWINPEGALYKLEIDGSGFDIKCSGISHIAVPEISIGDIVIFSTAGGGDMIADEADLIMGDNAPIARLNQRSWKWRLSEVVEEIGIDGLCRILVDQGLDIASPQNIKNWINPRGIAPGNNQHFQVLLKNCGLGEETDKFVNATDLIRRAHRAAGFRLSKRLLQMMKGRPLSDLVENGRQTFGGTSKIASEKTAFYIESISAETRSVPEHETGRPFSIK